MRKLVKEFVHTAGEHGIPCEYVVSSNRNRNGSSTLQSSSSSSSSDTALVATTSSTVVGSPETLPARLFVDSSLQTLLVQSAGLVSGMTLEEEENVLAEVMDTDAIIFAPKLHPHAQVAEGGGGSGKEKTHHDLFGRRAKGSRAGRVEQGDPAVPPPETTPPHEEEKEEISEQQQSLNLRISLADGLASLRRVEHALEEAQAELAAKARAGGGPARGGIQSEQQLASLGSTIGNAIASDKDKKRGLALLVWRDDVPPGGDNAPSGEKSAAAPLLPPQPQPAEAVPYVLLMPDEAARDRSYLALGVLRTLVQKKRGERKAQPGQ